MAKFSSVVGNILGLAASHVGCGVCTLFEGINYIGKKVFGSTYHYQPQFLPWAEHYKGKFTKQLEASYRAPDGKTSTIGNAEIIIGKAASYLLGFAGLLTFVALAAPKLGAVGGLFLGPTIITTAGYHIYRGAQSVGSHVRSKSDILKKGEEQHQKLLRDAQRAVDAGELPDLNTNRRREETRRSTTPNGSHHIR